MSDSGLKLSEETEREARERLAAKAEELAAQCDEFAASYHLQRQWHVDRAAELRRRAASLRGQNG